jgi:OTU domain-containing protein 3
MTDRTLKTVLQKAKWAVDLRRLDESLSAIGLLVRKVTGDGNCLFRAVSDQVCGNQEEHWDLRCRAVEFMRANPEDFEPFVDTDEYESWEGYLSAMAGEGEWGGHMELIALSKALRVNLCVHQLDEARWEITSFPPTRRRLHVSYHDGNHYNSVRLASDDASSKAASLCISDTGAAPWECEDPPSDEEDEASGPELRLLEALGGTSSLAQVRAALSRYDEDEDAALAALVTGAGGGAEGGAAGDAGASHRAGAAVAAGGTKFGGGGRKAAKKAKRLAKAAARIAKATAEAPEPAAAASRAAASASSSADASSAAVGDEEPVASSLKALSI